MIGLNLEPETLYLTRGRDFRWTFKLTDSEGKDKDFPAGEMFLELALDETPELPSRWYFDIYGCHAKLKVEHEVSDLVPNRCGWQLVWMPEGEDAGGDPFARGFVRVQK